MTRRTIALIAIAVMSASGADAPASTYLQGGAGKPTDPKATDVSREKIVAELNADLEKARQRLADDDPGAQTQSTQQRILDNIDRLLKQKDPNAGGSSSNPPPRPNNEPKPSSKPAASSPKQAPKPIEATSPQPQRPSNPQAGPVIPMKPHGSAKASASARSIDELKKTSAANEWGKLPPRFRQGMDAFGHDRFLPQYEEMLRAYYRSLGETSRRE